MAGKASVGLKGFVGLWERGRPPRLKMLENMRKKTLDELESLMAGLSHEWAGRDGGDGGDEEEADSVGRRTAAVVARKNVMAAFAKSSNDGQEEMGSARLNLVMVSNDSSFVPSEE